METTEQETYETYARLIALVDSHGMSYRLIDHAPEGRTEVVSHLRGNTLRQAAKCGKRLCACRCAG